MIIRSFDVYESCQAAADETELQKTLRVSFFS
jgi:hypothetical protein